MSVLKTQALLDIESQPALIFSEGVGMFGFYFFCLKKKFKYFENKNREKEKQNIHKTYQRLKKMHPPKKTLKKSFI